MIMLMIMPFTWQVFADAPLPEDQEMPDVQSENMQPEPPAAEAGKAVREAAEAPEVPVASEPAEPAATETPEVPEAVEPAEPDADAAAEADNAEPVTEAAPVQKAASAPEAAEEITGEAGTVRTSGAAKNITVDETSIDGSADCSGSGWTYEKESGRIVLRDYTGSADITSDGTGVDIVSTGYNRIGTLSCDGDINVIGTGVLLIDKVELAEGCSFNLLPLQEYYGADGGSVAVFLLQEDGSYMLVNKTVKGVIDERLELPEDVKLVLPADSLLELQAFRVKVETDEDGNKTVERDYSGNTEELEGETYEYYGGHLCVGDLTLNNRSKIINNKLGDSIAAGIIVGGNLINEGLISGGSVTVVQKDSGGGGLYSGSGTIEDSFITFRTGQTMSINVKGSTLNLEEGKYTIEQLNLTGKSELNYRDGLEINNLKGASESSLDIYSFDMTDYLKFTGTIDGVDVLIKSGITELESGLQFLNGGTVSNKRTVSDGTTVSNKNYGSLVFDYNGGSVVSDGTSGPVSIGPKTDPATDPATDPVSDPASDPATDPASDPATDPASDPATDPASDPVTDPISDPVSDPASDPVTDPISDPATDPASDPATDPISDPVSDPATDPGIPVVYLNLQRTVNTGGDIELIENNEGQEYKQWNNYEPEETDNGKIYYDKLIEKYFPDGPVFQRPDQQKIIIEVLRYKDKKLSLTILDGSDEYGHETDSEGVFLIRIAYLDTWKNSVGGTTVTSTRASQTGSGNIGGNSNSIITGTGITRFSSDPVDPDPEPVKPDPKPVKPDPKPVKPDPEPVKPDPEPVKPDPEPVKPDTEPANPDPEPANPDADPVNPDADPVKPDMEPVKPDTDHIKSDTDHAKPLKVYTVAAVTANGDELTIHINEYDLNEGVLNDGKAPYYSLSAYINGAQTNELSAPVKVEMDCELPEEFRGKPVYAVFANVDKASDETLTAVSAAYDEEAGKLTFETSQLGEFIVVAFEFDGEEFSPEFYDELEKTDEAKLFIKHLEEKKENAGL